MAEQTTKTSEMKAPVKVEKQEYPLIQMLMNNQ